MAFYEIKADRTFFDNETRQQWKTRLRDLHEVTAVTLLLRSFRGKHLGPKRSSYLLENDALWIESVIEGRLSQLKAVEKSFDELLGQCTSGEPAERVCEEWIAKVEAADEVETLENVALEYRRDFKPPIMPVQYWLKTEKVLVTRLMELRSDSAPQNLSIEDLRAKRGARLVGDTIESTHTITAHFEDGESLSFACRESENVIAAALRDQINLLSQCRRGQCATCKAVCGKGDFEFGEDVNAYSLPQEEQDEGLILACQTYPRSDMDIEFPYSREMVVFGAKDGRGQLLSRVHSIDSSATRCHLILEHVNPDTKRARQLSYTPGQYLNIQIPGTDQWRSFSMATPSRADGLLEFLIKLVPGGLLSQHLLNNAHVGEEMVVRGPYGMFHINEHSQKPTCFVASGTGLAPILAMLRHCADTQDRRPKRLLHLVNKEDIELYSEDLREVAEALPELALQSCITGPDDFAPLFADMIASSPDKPEVYICGSDAIVSSAEAICRKAKIGVRNVYLERRLPTGPDLAGKK